MKALRVQLRNTMTITPLPGSALRPCNNCGGTCVVSQHGMIHGKGMPFVCDRCLPAEPVGRIERET